MRFAPAVAAAALVSLAACSASGAAAAGPGARSRPPATPRATAPTLAALAPVAATGGAPPNGPALVAQDEPVQGPQTLPAFVPRGNVLFVTFSCLGPGGFSLGTLFDSSPCDGQSSTVTLRGQAGLTLAPTVQVAATTSWRMLVQDGTEPAP